MCVVLRIFRTKKPLAAFKDRSAPETFSSGKHAVCDPCGMKMHARYMLGRETRIPSRTSQGLACPLHEIRDPPDGSGAGSGGVSGAGEDGLRGRDAGCP